MAQVSLSVDERAGRVHVVFNRPVVRNAIDQAMVDELHVVCERLEAEPKLLVISGAGGTFALGADIRQLRERGREDALAGINVRSRERRGARRSPRAS